MSAKANPGHLSPRSGTIPRREPVGACPPGPLQDRDDIRQLISKLWRPLLDLSSDSNAFCRPGETGAIFDNGAAALEGFCRPLWGVLACAAHGEFVSGTELLPPAIAAGVDPDHADYWGEFAGGDQRCVEMAVLGWSLATSPSAFWERLDPRTQTRLATWLSQINEAKGLPANNWRFFRILVNLGLRAVGQPYSPEMMAHDLELIESYYLGEGWYSDGRGAQRDYYISMAMHFYGLLIAAYDPLDLAAYTTRYRARARRFAGDFIHWFVPDGPALPYGRSLIYRFAQGAFWAALAWANEEALPWGTIKGILLRHVRSWLANPIFDKSGVLTIGYQYPNLNMAESYNSPASPYWAMKALLVGGLPANHPFWQAEEEPLPSLPDKSVQRHPGFIIRRHDNQRHITVLASGQFPTGWHLRHAAAKYAKFAYSTRFGFSVPVGAVTLEDGAYDNMLALSDDGHHWRVRETCSEAGVEDERLVSTWSLWPDVSVRTWLFFDAEWQVRIHRLKTGRQLFSAEAGHAIPRLDLQLETEERYWQVDQGLAAVIHPDTAAGILDPGSKRTGTVVVAAPNSNLLHPRTILPTLRGTHAPGVHWLVSLLPITCSPSLFSKLLKPDVDLKIHRHPKHLALRLPSGETAIFPAEGQAEVHEDPEAATLTNDERAAAASEQTADVCG